MAMALSPVSVQFDPEDLVHLSALLDGASPFPAPSEPSEPLESEALTRTEKLCQKYNRRYHKRIVRNPSRRVRASSDGVARHGRL